MVSKKDQKLKHTKKQQNPVTHRACGQAKHTKGGKHYLLFQVLATIRPGYIDM